MKIDVSGPLFLGRLSEELSDLIVAQCSEVFSTAGLVIPVKSCSLMRAIEKLEPASARDLADALERSHQLISQKLPKLLKFGLLECEPDPMDSRQKLYRMTARGKQQMQIFEDLQPRLEAAYQQLFSEVGPVPEVIQQAINALETRPVARRL